VSRAIPPAVYRTLYRGMCVAAMARAERCQVLLEAGQVHLRNVPGFRPSAELREAFASSREAIARALIVGVPVIPPTRRGDPARASWPLCAWGTSGAVGPN
jgi:hypothetical protein